ncbi:MAG: hypothetical protein ACR2M3_02400 [Thermomicrobiales bacterium]
MAAPHPTSAEHVYYTKWHRRYRWMLFCYPVIGAFNLIEGILTHSWWNAIIGAYFLALIPFTMKSWRSIRLVITPDGIAYHSGGGVLNVPWQDMEYIGRISQRWYRGWEGIILRNAHWERPRWFLWPKRWSPQFIPLWSRWNGPWWDRELFDNLFRYAPWLADSGGESGNDQGNHA